MILTNSRETFILAVVCITLLIQVTYGSCPVNEILVDEGLSCPDNSCRTPAECPRYRREPSGILVCRCRQGYVRNYRTANGTCMLPSDCPVDLELECERFGGEWIRAGKLGCEKSCASPDICVNFITPHDSCFCGLYLVREYWPDGECILNSECNESNSIKSKFIYLFVCISAYFYATFVN